jgi:hypothetical protein
MRYHAEHLEMILHNVHEAHDVHYTPIGALVDVVYAHLPVDTGIAPTDVHTAVWAWRMSNRVCVLVDDSGDVIHRPLLWYMAVPETLIGV